MACVLNASLQDFRIWMFLSYQIPHNCCRGDPIKLTIYLRWVSLLWILGRHYKIRYLRDFRLGVRCCLFLRRSDLLWFRGNSERISYNYVFKRKKRKIRFTWNSFALSQIVDKGYYRLRTRFSHFWRKFLARQSIEMELRRNYWGFK